MSVTALVERPKFTDSQLTEVLNIFRREYGDIGLAIAGMHLELKERITALEERIAKLETRKR